MAINGTKKVVPNETTPVSIETPIAVETKNYTEVPDWAKDLELKNEKISETIEAAKKALVDTYQKILLLNKKKKLKKFIFEIKKMYNEDEYYRKVIQSSEILLQLVNSVDEEEEEGFPTNKEDKEKPKKENDILLINGVKIKKEKLIKKIFPNAKKGFLNERLTEMNNYLSGK